jgi:hypothetical protein
LLWLEVIQSGEVYFQNPLQLPQNMWESKLVCLCPHNLNSCAWHVSADDRVQAAMLCFKIALALYRQDGKGLHCKDKTAKACSMM